MLAQAHVEKTVVVPALPKKSLEKIFFLASLSIVGFLIILAGMQFLKTGFFVNQRSPRNLVLSNITDVSFTVVWDTNETSTGYVVYGKSPENLIQKAYDNFAVGDMTRFSSQKHRVTLTGLEPNTHYYFGIVSNGKSQNMADGNFLPPVKTAVESVF
jgi:hypothetical protein